MPNPKVGTVTMDVATAVKNAKAGQVQYRTDKGGLVHMIGRASFSVESLEQNIRALIDALNKAKPAGARAISAESRDFRHDGPWCSCRSNNLCSGSRKPQGFYKLWAVALLLGAADRQRPQVPLGA